MVDPEFDELKREFLAEAEEKAREIQSLLDAGLLDTQAVDRMIFLAHQLKGAGGSYGFQAISTQASSLETYLEHLSSSVETPKLDQIQWSVRTLASEIANRGRELAVADPNQLSGDRRLPAAED